MYSAVIAAQYIILRCNQLGKSISNLKLQKMLYFLQAEFLVSQDRPCFRERIEAWDFGPVVPEVSRLQANSIRCSSGQILSMMKNFKRELLLTKRKCPKR